jgi:hypothetical protein
MALDKQDPPEESQASTPPDDTSRPLYEPPQIIAYDEAALADIVGPAVACARWNPVGHRP